MWTGPFFPSVISSWLVTVLSRRFPLSGVSSSLTFIITTEGKRSVLEVVMVMVVNGG